MMHNNETKLKISQSINHFLLYAFMFGLVAREYHVGFIKSKGNL